MIAASDTEPAVATAVELLRRHVRATPDRRAADFVDGLGRETDAFSYAQLDGEARRIAGTLAARLPRGATVIVAEPPGLRFVAAFFGCLYAGMIAVQYPTDSPSRGRAKRILGQMREFVIRTDFPKPIRGGFGIVAKSRLALT